MENENLDKMEAHHKELIKKYLENHPTGTKILFYDNVDGKRVDIGIWHEKSDNEIYMYGDESQIYDFDELDLIDEVVLNCH